MVRLKLIYPRQQHVELPRSQFHYGSIKTAALRKMIIIILESQFHYGSIKTVQSRLI